MPGLTEEQRRLIAEGAIVPRRERIATAVLAGLVANETNWTAEDGARVAVIFAKALMKELDRR